MRAASRMIVAASLGLGLACAAGCGSKGDATPAQPNVALTPGTGGEPDGKPAPEPPKPVYEPDTARQVIPAAPVSGVVAGEPVTPEVRIEDRTLLFRKAAAAAGEPWEIRVELPPEAVRGEPYKLVVPRDQFPGVLVFANFPRPLALKGVGPTRTLAWRDGCPLTLELGRREKGKIAGKVYLALGEVDAEQESQRRTFLAGTFEAERPRQPTETPTVEDVPFVAGAVTVRGAAPNAELVVGYAATPTPTTSAFATTSIGLGDPVVPPRWVQVDYDAPRVTSLVAGNGKDVPSRYEHTRLTPGQYLVFAAVKGGPVAWKWVTVPVNGTVTADLTIDAAAVGGLEVTAPLEAVGKKLQLGAVGEPGHPSLADGLFQAVAGQLGLERDVAARKALFTNLAPGRYEVRAGKEYRLVEVVAGKTAELDFDRPPPPPVPASASGPEIAPPPRPKP